LRNRNLLTGTKRAYTKIPNKILSLGLSGNALAVFMKCISMPENFNPSLRFLSEELDIDKKTVTKALIELTDNKVLNKIETGSIKKVSRYEFNNPKDWVKKVKASEAESDKTKSSNEGQVKVHKKKET